jgi:gamma-glutamyltranspeptidase
MDNGKQSSSRNNYLGAPDFVSTPVQHLLDKAYATQIRNSISLVKAGVSSEIQACHPYRHGASI